MIMGHYNDYRVATYRRQYDGCVIDTKEGWAKKGFVVIQRRKGEKMYTNGWKGQIAVYYYEKDVKSDSERAKKIIKNLKAKKKINAKKNAKKKEKQNAEITARWVEFFGPEKTVLIFDTDTTGLDAYDNNILSISWQLLRMESVNSKWTSTVLEKKDIYFDWPEDMERVTQEAIDINGLTQDKLAELGTVERKEGLSVFLQALNKAGAVVAHNYWFDADFVYKEMNRAGLSGIRFPQANYCTMREMTYKCCIPRGNGEYKWPRLIDLAYHLRVAHDDLPLHLSGEYVELTKRCFLRLVQKCIDFPVLSPSRINISSSSNYTCFTPSYASNVNGDFGNNSSESDNDIPF